MAKNWPPALTVSAGMMVRVSGTRMARLHALAGSAVDVDDAADPLDIGADHVHADAAAGNGGDLAGGGEAGQEDQSGLLRGGQLLGLLGREEAGGAGLADQRLAVDAAAVVGGLDQDLVAGLARRDPERAGRGLAGGGALVGRLDAMVDRVADDMGQGIADHLDHLAVELDVAAVGLEPDLLAEIGGKIADQPRQAGEQAVDPLHAGAGDAVADLGDAGRDPLERRLDGDVARRVAQAPGELVARQHGVGDAVHHPVEQIDREADASAPPSASPARARQGLGLARPAPPRSRRERGDQLLVILARQRFAGFERLDELADPVDHRQHRVDQRACRRSRVAGADLGQRAFGGMAQLGRAAADRRSRNCP